VASSSLVILPASVAQTKSDKPSTPIFTVQTIDHSHLNPLIYGVDPNTKEKLPNWDQYVKNVTVNVSIKNQIYTRYPDDYSRGTLYFECRYKDHFEGNWQYVISNKQIKTWTTNDTRKPTLIKAVVTSDYTQISFDINRECDSDEHLTYDIQVKAVIRLETIVPAFDMYSSIYEEEWLEGNWSSSQKITLPSLMSSPKSSPPPSNTSPTNNPNPSTSDQSNIDNLPFGLASWVGVVVVLFSVIVVLLVVIAVALWRKKWSQSNSALNTVYLEVNANLGFGDPAKRRLTCRL
jgi:hypothetical protein